MLKTMKADLHIHTCLSPCADLRMSPQTIAEQAKIKEIDILGICDHNTAENVPALIRAAGRYEISVLPGLEVTSQEEVHILALFDRLEPAIELQGIIYDHLPGENDEEAFGMQVVVDENGEVLRFNNKLLIGASTLTVNEVVEAIHSLKGLAVASHVDREGFSLTGQLGFIPPDLNLDALEISPLTSRQEALEKFGASYPLTFSSDAHFPEDIGKSLTSFYITEASTEEIKKALSNTDGRRIIN
jgi:PHP family Zn ribbon phosphoesterase